MKPSTPSEHKYIYDLSVATRLLPEIYRFLYFTNFSCEVIKNIRTKKVLKDKHICVYPNLKKNCKIIEYRISTHSSSKRLTYTTFTTFFELSLSLRDKITYYNQLILMKFDLTKLEIYTPTYVK